MGFKEFDQGIPSSHLQRWKTQQVREEFQKELALRWKESERVQGILRSSGSSITEDLTELVTNWYNRVRGHQPVHQGAGSWTPNSWFAALFPEERHRYGDAFFEEMTTNRHGRLVKAPSVLNEDFFAAILGGEKRLGHRMVYLPSEGFLFNDPKVDAFCATSDEKVGILLSNYLVKCAERMGSDVDTKPLLHDHRRPSVIAAVVKRAKSVLEAKREFFQGADAPRRYEEGRVFVVPQISAPETFIHGAFLPMEGCTVVVSEAYQQFLRYCEMESLLRVEFTEFKRAARELVQEKFQLGLRHDIRTPEGRQTHGWKHLRLLSNFSSAPAQAA
jgi:hypothetical protein